MLTGLVVNGFPAVATAIVEVLIVLVIVLGLITLFRHPRNKL